jgi:hypothetical protein
VLTSKHHGPVKRETGEAIRGKSAPKIAQPGSCSPLWQQLATRVQTKLDVSEPGDVYEQEADRVGEHVMRMPAHERIAATKGGPALRSVDPVPQSFGQPLDPGARAFFEPRFGYDLGNVRIHTDAGAVRSAAEVQARAYAVGNNLVFGTAQYSPHSERGRRLLAHELTHVVQQTAPSELGATRHHSPSIQSSVVKRSRPRVARDGIIEVELISSRDEYTLPGTKVTYRVGDAAASRLLMDIQERGSNVVFLAFNFETGEAAEMSPALWDFFRGAAIIGGSNAGIAQLGHRLTPSKWRNLWPNPLPALLRMYEAGQLALDDEAVLTGYHGMIRTEAAVALDRNEKAINELLAESGRVERIQKYTTGLREASVVRDALIHRRDEVNRRLVAQHSFTFGLPHAGTGPDMVQNLAIHRELGELNETLAFWIASFPLLSRFRTEEISTSSVLAKLREIQANIVATRERLDKGRLDPMTLDNVRAHIAGNLGPKATAVIQADDKARSRVAIAGAVALTVGSILLMFLPFGIFIDAAIGVAMAAEAIANAEVLGQAADTAFNVDDGLVSQSQAQGARFAAVLAVVFSVVGAASAGFRVLRVGLALRGLSESFPDLALAQRAAVARAIADDPALMRVFTKVAADDMAISSRVAGAVRAAGNNPAALRAALTDVARIAAFPRRIPTTPDLYQPFRNIADGSDIARIAQSTGLSRAEVQAAKRNLMLEEHILVDNTGAVYRARFDPFPEVASAWGRAARGEALKHGDREFLQRLVRHEEAEGAILSSQAQTLEQAFLHCGLEGNLRKFLQGKGWNQAKIDQLLTVEPMPITPYRYAHLVSALSGAPNP